jgi:transmembrane sensor
MSRIVNFPTQDVMLEQAAQWLLRLEQGRLNEQEKRALKTWLAQSSQHVDAFRDTLTTWDKMDVLAGLSDIFPLEKMASTRHQNHLQAVPISWGGSIAAVLVVCALGLGALQLSGIFGPRGDDATLYSTLYSTQIGGKKQVVLEDGSIVTLNTNTQLQIAFNQSQRAVNLLQGEAFFEVEKETKRPFVVYAAGGQVTAVGTAFSVYKKNGVVEVTVTEGVVQLDSTTKVLPGQHSNQHSSQHTSEHPNEQKLSDSASAVLVEKGHVASYGETIGSVESVEPEVIAKRLFWQQGMLAFEGESLQDVVAEFSRYSSLNITIADDEIRGVRVGGYFKSDDIAGMLNSLQYNFGIHVVRLDKDHVRLEKAP